MIGSRTIQNILAVQLNFCLSVAGDIHCSFINFLLHLNVHITEPDLEFLGRFAHPVIDDLDDIRGGVIGAAHWRGRSGGGVGLSGLLGLCRRGGRGGGEFRGLLLRIRVCRGVLVHHILLGGVLGGLFLLLGGVLALLGLGRVLLCLAQGKACVRVRLALPGSVRRPGCFQLLRGGTGGRGYRRICPGTLSTLSLRQGGIRFAGAVLDHNFVALIFVGGSPLSYFHILLAALIRHGLYVNAAFADIVNIRKGRGCNGRNNRHDGCCRQHPQS